MKRVSRLGILASLVSLGVLAGAAAAPGTATALSPLVVGWERFFELRWGGEMRAGRPVVAGDVVNTFGVPARRVQLLVENLDAAGQVTSQTVAWLGSELTPGSRAYFEVPVAQAAPSYRVTVFAFEWIQVGGGDLR